MNSENFIEPARHLFAFEVISNSERRPGRGKYAATPEYRAHGIVFGCVPETQSAELRRNLQTAETATRMEIFIKAATTRWKDDPQKPNAVIIIMRCGANG